MVEITPTCPLSPLSKVALMIWIQEEICPAIVALKFFRHRTLFFTHFSTSCQNNLVRQFKFFNDFQRMFRQLPIVAGQIADLIQARVL